MTRTKTSFLNRLGDTVVRVIGSRHAELPLSILFFIPLMCVIAYWLIGDWIAGRKIGGMD